MGRQWFFAAACLASILALAAPAPAQAVPPSEAPSRTAGLARLTAAAERGHAGAQHELGRRLALGLGVPSDEAAARVWLARAARGDHAGAKALLAELTLEGRGGPAAPIEALRWLAEAADQGDGRAQERLGALYAEGALVPRDDVTALVFFELAAHAGRRSAGAAAARLRASALDAGQLAEGRRRLRAWRSAHPSAAKHGAP